MLHRFLYNTFIVKFNSLFFSNYLGATLTYRFLHKNFKILCALKKLPTQILVGITSCVIKSSHPEISEIKTFPCIQILSNAL